MSSSISSPLRFSMFQAAIGNMELPTQFFFHEQLLRTWTDALHAEWRRNQLSGHKKLLSKIESKEAKVTIVGLGYIGLPTALFYKKNGLAITGIDTNEELVTELRAG
ncbi:MAG: hypothetical protein ACFFAZ_15045, partial [Promethearchaeota archaeon]